MPKAVVLIHNGFEEIEFITPIDVLRRAGIDVVTYSMTDSNIVHGNHSIDIYTDRVFDENKFARDYDALVLTGGSTNACSLRDDPRVISEIRQAFKNNKLVCGVCASPIALERAEVLEGKKCTCYPGCYQDTSRFTYVEEPVVVCDNIITSMGPGTSIAYALSIVEKLINKETAEKLSQGMIYDRILHK